MRLSVLMLTSLLGYRQDMLSQIVNEFRQQRQISKSLFEYLPVQYWIQYQISYFFIWYQHQEIQSLERCSKSQLFACVHPAQPVPFSYNRLQTQHLGVFEGRLPEVEGDSFGEVQSKFARVSLFVGEGQSEADESPPANLQILSLPIFKDKVEFVFSDVEFIERRQSLPELLIVQHEPPIVGGACSSQPEEDDAYILYFDLTSEEESLMKQDRRRVEFVPGQQRLEIGLGDEVVHVLTGVQAGHVVHDVLFVVVFSDEESGAWHFGSWFVQPGEFVQEGCFAGVGETHQLDSSHHFLLNIALQTLDTCLADAADHENLNFLHFLPQSFLFSHLPILQERDHPSPHLLQDEMFVEILLIHDVQLIDDDRKFDVLIQQTIEDVLLQTAGDVQHVHKVEIESGSHLMLVEDLGEDDLLVVFWQSVGHVELIGQFVVVLETEATIAEDLGTLLAGSADGLVFLLELVNLLLQSQQHFNIVQIVQAAHSPVEYLHAELLLDLVHHIQRGLVLAGDLRTIGFLDEFDVAAHSLLEDLCAYEAVFLFVLALEKTVAAVAPMLLVVLVYCIRHQRSSLDGLQLLLLYLLVQLQLAVALHASARGQPEASPRQGQRQSAEVLQHYKCGQKASGSGEGFRRVRGDGGGRGWGEV